MSKPSRATIAASTRLTETRHRVGAAMLRCNVCGQGGPLRVYQECDERDKPIPGALLYVGTDHRACVKAVNRHPRLYLDARAEPGTFGICGHCIERDGSRCMHPKLLANGGPPPGLRVTMGHGEQGFLCGSFGLERTGELGQAIKCEGRATLRLIRRHGNS